MSAQHRRRLHKLLVLNASSFHIQIHRFKWKIDCKNVRKTSRQGPHGFQQTQKCHCDLRAATVSSMVINLVVPGQGQEVPLQHGVVRHDAVPSHLQKSSFLVHISSFLIHKFLVSKTQFIILTHHKRKCEDKNSLVPGVCSPDRHGVALAAAEPNHSLQHTVVE